jgi:hypothetical protein
MALERSFKEKLNVIDICQLMVLYIIFRHRLTTRSGKTGFHARRLSHASWGACGFCRGQNRHFVTLGSPQAVSAMNKGLSSSA